MESDDPAVAAMHLAYAATFDPSVYLACGRCIASTRWLLPQPPMMPPSRPPLGGGVYRMMPRTPLREHIMDQDVPSWRLWVNRCMAGRCHSRIAAFLASGTVFAPHKDDPAAREERAKTGEPLRVRPLGVGSVLVRMASAHALVQVGADAREAMGPRREAHAALLERIASFGTSEYGCHHGAMRLLIVCAVQRTGFLSRMMPPSELDPFLEAVDTANISDAFSLLGSGFGLNPTRVAGPESRAPMLAIVPGLGALIGTEHWTFGT
eukprot:jgi/Tetstr1/462691/TSEL_007657.t1